MNRVRVAVLMGGISSERDVSLKTGRKIAQALERRDFEVVPLEIGSGGACDRTGNSSPARELVPLLIDGRRPDVVFVALHGRFGEDGTVQGLLELLGIPYTGSGVLASALALNKAVSKKLMLAEGIRTPPFVLVRDLQEGLARASELPLPLVVKPNHEGSTIGVTIVHYPEQLGTALEHAFRYDTEVLLEQFIKGTEITAGVIGNEDPQVLPLVEIVPMSGFYDYEAKYTPGATEEIVPARIPEARAREARDLALRAHKVLGCRGMSRVDMICTPDEVWVLEVNTIPGMTETSLLPRAAAAAGMSFEDLVVKLVELALKGRRALDGG
ncbi:MAG: D-alanine--D-alanine ligase family protein [Armatimonadota bacterium]